jgi:hypothetical protein
MFKVSGIGEGPMERSRDPRLGRIIRIWAMNGCVDLYNESSKTFSPEQPAAEYGMGRGKR